MKGLKINKCLDFGEFKKGFLMSGNLDSEHYIKIYVHVTNDYCIFINHFNKSSSASAFNVYNTVLCQILEVKKLDTVSGLRNHTSWGEKNIHVQKHLIT